MGSQHPIPALRILVVDDDPHVRKFLRLSLGAEGFNVLEAATAEEALEMVQGANPALMILDLGLPDIDGHQVIRDVRLQTEMPILVLSGRTEDHEKILSLEQGADDYMTKPFAVKELVRRVRAAVSETEARSSWQKDRSVVTGGLNIRLMVQDVRIGDAAIALDAEEYALLRVLALHAGRVLTYRRIANALWGHATVHDADQQLDMQRRISGLRRKLEAEPSFPRYIVTEPAVGYRLEMLPTEIASVSG